ncbi:MAG: site-2 protease family protein [Oscillospiraceae bacterium]|nr:site-2 protease family protein [Oscillospiraceae bacterium]
MGSVLSVILFNILIPLLILSLLIFIHELGHYLGARIFKVAIKEFAVGMGPRILSHKSKKTKIIYSIRAIPMGGALTMHGEDEESDIENAVSKKPVWQRFIIISAGSVMNILLGFIIMSVIVSGAKGFYSNKINRFDVDATSNINEHADERLMESDEILKVNNKKINVYNDLLFAIIHDGKDPVNITVLRNGEKIELKNIKFPTGTEDGMIFGIVDFETQPYPKTFSSVVHQAFFQSLSTIDMVWTTFFDMITGRYGMEAVSGPVGVTQTIGNSAKEAVETKEGGRGLLFLLALITMNLGVVNLLPLPALDGGRIIFLIIEFIRGKPIKPEYEGYVHLAGFALLMLFMIFITYKDIMKLIVG